MSVVKSWFPSWCLKGINASARSRFGAGLHQPSGGEGIPGCRESGRVVEDAPGFDARCGIPREHLRDGSQILRAVGRVVDLGRAMQAIVRQAAPPTWFVSFGNRGRVSGHAGDPKLVEQGVDLRREPRGMTGLADDTTFEPA